MFNNAATTETKTLSLHDALPILIAAVETTTISARAKPALKVRGARVVHDASTFALVRVVTAEGVEGFGEVRDRKSTRLNSSHSQISYAVFCLIKKKNELHSNRLA